MVNQTSTYQNGGEPNYNGSKANGTNGYTGATNIEAGFIETHHPDGPVKTARSMFSELDPNPSMNATAPMDAMSNPPVAKVLMERECESVSPSERRLDPSLLNELKTLLSDPFVRSISLTSSKTSDDEVEQYLEEEKGDAEVWEYGTQDFRLHSTVFNGTVRSRAPLLVRPRTARQVSRCVLFCQKHNLELSVKSGGYGTHGWSVAGQLIIDLSLISAVAVSLPDSPQSPLPSLRSMKLSVNRHRERSDAVRNTNGTVTSVVRDPKGKGKQQGNGAGDGPEAGMASPPLAYNAGFGFDSKLVSSPNNGGAGKRSISEAWHGDENDQPRQAIHNGDSASSTKPRLASRNGSDSTRLCGNSDENVLDEAAKKSLMAGLDGPTEFEPSFQDAHASSFQSATPLNFGSAIPPLIHPGNMPGLADPRWQFGSSSTSLSTGGMFDPTYVMGYPGSAGLGGISNSYFGSQISSDTTTSSSGPTSQSRSSSTPTSLFSNMSPSSLPPYTVVTFGSGATAKQIDKVSHASPWGAFHVPLAAFPVGSAVMMTGGFGFLGRLHGLSMDNLLEIEYVLSDGRIVWLSGLDAKNEGTVIAVENADGTEGQLTEQEGKDLWFAIRGAGTAMGIATRYRAKAYHVPVVYAGNLIYPFNRETTPHLIQHVRDCVKASPRKLYVNMILTAGPAHLAGVVVVQLCFVGSQESGAEYLSAISSWEEERCLFKDIRERDFLEQQDSVANILKGGAGRKWFIKSDLLNSLSDDVISETCRQFHSVPDGCTWLFELTAGAVTDATTTCLPKSHREALYTVAALHQWPVNIPQEDVRCVLTARDWIDKTIHPDSPGGPLPCFQSSSHPEAIRGMYGENIDRLVSIKQHFDPDNFFRHSLWPASGHRGNLLASSSERAEDVSVSEDVKQVWREEDERIGRDGVLGIGQSGHKS
ncbi:hypothetical protein QFC22_001825 [Naganishia vaughanmartiniae]|uniref:Uncharacterized protein n=1 Tax=Naganishia vaughanmartiniae TaxID=1424756 RepID=A0ACC2XI52_9TREE|nr:hypothetical protein QFC22_001825 [Naganishia vaughanmartiniae]